jgi:hypothetical protein
MSTYKLLKVKTYSAHAGPSQDFINQHAALVKERVTPTRAGRYVVHSIDKHVSSQRWLLSTIAWGTPMKFEKGVVYIQRQSKWVKLSSTNSQWVSGGSEKDLHDWLLDQYQSYSYKGTPLYQSATPDKWVFNDFGHVSVKYFKDLNNNYQLDKKESLMSDFIHTTPNDEALTAYNKQFPETAKPIELVSSHGCVHVKPNDIDEMIAKKYIEKGTSFVVHPYSASPVIENVIEVNDKSKPPVKAFEVHFFPMSSLSDKTTGGGEIVIYSVNR